MRTAALLEAGVALRPTAQRFMISLSMTDIIQVMKDAHGVESVRGYVAVVGPEAEVQSLALHAALEAEAMARVVGTGWRMRTFGRRTPTITPPLGKDDRAWIVGRPFALSDPASLPALDPHDDAATHRTLRALDGRFSLLMANGRSLVVATDALALGGVYYAEQRGRLYLASHLGPLLHALPDPPPPDPVGLASLLITRCALDDRTAYRGVRRLGPGMALHARCDVDRLDWRLERYHDLADLARGAAPPAGTDARVDRFDELITEAVAREPMSGRTAVLLSGGRDSCALLLALRQLGRAGIEAVTYGEPDSTDLRRARRLARAARIPHCALTGDEWDLSTFADHIVALNGGATSIKGGHAQPGYRYAAAHYGLAVVGLLGDALSGGHLPTHTEPSFDAAMRFIASKLHTFPWLRDYCGDEIDELLDAARARYDALADLPPHARYMLTDLSTRQATWISQGNAQIDACLDVAYPFAYRPLVSYMLGLPAEELVNQRLYDRWLDRTMRRVVGRAHRPQRRSGETLRKIWRKLTGRTPTPPKRIDWRKLADRSRHFVDPLLASIDPADALAHVAVRSGECESSEHDDMRFAIATQIHARQLLVEPPAAPAVQRRRKFRFVSGLGVAAHGPGRA